MKKWFGSRGTRRLLSLALSAAMVLSLLPMPSIAAEDDGLCEHHTEHTDCGYVAAVEGQDCGHQHNEACGYAEASDCGHQHDESCGYAEARDCTHSHNDACGYRESSPCNHEHDDSCGYVEPVAGQPCGFVCEECAGASEPELLLEDTVITDWEWVDEWEIIDPDSGKVLLPFASAENVAKFDDIAQMLPVSITVDGEELSLGEWLCSDYPKDGAYEGEYVFETTLPEGYVLDDGSNVLSLTVVLGTPEEEPAAVTFAGSGHTHCICGATHQDIGDHTAEDALEWQPWGSWNTSGTATPFPVESGNYYLTEDVMLPDQSWWAIPANSTINLCLNGHTITAGRMRFAKVSTNAILCITDCSGSENAKIRAGLEETFEGVEVESGGKFELFGGKMEGFPTIVNNSGIFNMYGGTLSGNKGVCYRGGGVYNSGTFHMYGGTIRGCSVTAGSYTGGGGIYNKGTVHMSGGGIIGCAIDSSSSTAYASGSGVYNDGTFNMSGGSITGNWAYATSNVGQSYFGYGFYNLGTLNISGNAFISGNTIGNTNGTPANLLIPNDHPANITGNLDSGAKIGVTHLSGYGTVANVASGVISETSYFIPDDTAKEAVTDSSGNIRLKGKGTAISLNTEIIALPKKSSDTALITATLTGSASGQGITWSIQYDSDTDKYITISPNGNTCTVSVAQVTRATGAWVTATAADGTSASCRVIAYDICENPTLSSTRIQYDGNQRTVSFSSSTVGYELSGDTSATAIGDYTITVTPGEYYRWADGSAGPKSLNWSIVQGTARTPALQDIVYYPGDALNTVKFVDTDWHWVDGSEILTPGTQRYLARYKDGVDYADVSVYVKLAKQGGLRIEGKNSYVSGDAFQMTDVTVYAKYYEDGTSNFIGEKDVTDRCSIKYKRSYGYEAFLPLQSGTILTADSPTNQDTKWILRAEYGGSSNNMVFWIKYLATYVPTITLTYNGEFQRPVATGCSIDAYWTKDAGEYTSMVEPDGLSVWADTKTTEKREVKWSIKQATNEWTAEPSISGWTYGENANNPTMGSAKFGKVYVRYLTGENISTSVPTNAGSYTARFIVWENSNYSGLSMDVPFTISPKPVTVSGITAEDKTYDGGKTATLNTTQAVITGVLESDTLTVTATGAFEDENAGENKTVNITGLTLGGASKDNYTLAAEGQQTTTTATISVRSIDKPQENTTAFTYTGSEQTYTLTESEWYTITDNTRTDAGSQTVTVALKDTQNTRWADGTTDNVTFSFAIGKAASSVTAAPADARSLYTGGDVSLIKKGTAQGGTMQYRLGEDGEWSTAVPAATECGTYTVYYKVVGNQNHNDSAIASLTAEIVPFRIYSQPQPESQEINYGTSIKRSVGLDTNMTEGISYQWCLVTEEEGRDVYTPLENETGSELTLTKPNAGTYVYACIITCGDYSETSGKATVTVTAVQEPLPPTSDLPEGLWVEGGEEPLNGNSIDLKSPSSFLMTSYTYNGASDDVHQNYPTGMQVYSVDTDEQGRKTVNPIADLGNLLQYSGCSIRITGKPGIRMITSLTKEAKEALKKGELAGYTLEEYGTVVAWSKELDGPLTLSTGKSNYAYRKGVSDPVFANVGNLTQYTNVLVWDSLEDSQYAEDIVMRPYIILSKDGETVTLYGGTVERSIYYVAQQNANTFPKGSAGYNYVHEIIGKVDKLTEQSQPS